MIKPWEGTKWGKAGNMVGGIRLLVVGESAHAEEYPIGSAPAYLLRTTVSDYISSDSNWRFYRIVTALLTEKNTADIEKHERAAAWQSVAFVNYVPVVAANYSRERPSREMFKQGAQPFRKLLDRLSPEAILVLGVDTWGWMMQGLELPGNHWDKPKTPFALVGEAVAARLIHPSRGFSYKEWRPVFHELLARAKARRRAAARGSLRSEA